MSSHDSSAPAGAPRADDRSRAGASSPLTSVDDRIDATVGIDSLTDDAARLARSWIAAAAAASEGARERRTAERLG
ncbi:hypothetical protein DLJ96_07630, partial [Actinotalea fermentans ATCC 43279 = JCM 9966 = DSM 3133]